MFYYIYWTCSQLTWLRQLSGHSRVPLGQGRDACSRPGHPFAAVVSTMASLAADVECDELRDGESTPIRDGKSGARSTADSSTKQCRHGRRPGKGQRRCEACQVIKPESEFAMNQNVDAQCKRFLDNINKQARKAGGDAKARLDKIRADPKRCKRMIEMYRKAYAAWEGGSKPKSGVAFSVVTFMEETEASTAIEYVGEKQLMWEKQALTFWQSVDGGCLTEEEAQSRWSSMVANIEADRTVTDHKGPQKKPLRMAIGTRDIVANKNAFIKKRKMLCEEKGIKKASQAFALLMLVLLPLLFLPVYT